MEPIKLDLNSSLTQAANAFKRHLRWLGGIDRRVLAQCSKAEQSTYGALPYLMIATAAVTGGGVAYKSQEYMGLGVLGVAMVFAFVFYFALILEAAIVNSVKSAGSAGKSLLLRLGLTIIIGCVQVIPWLILAHQDRINLALYESGVATQLGLKDKTERLADLKGVKEQAKQLVDAELKARAELAAPPSDLSVRSAQATLESAQRALKAGQSALANQRKRIGELRAALARAKDDVAREKIDAAITKGQASLSAHAGNVNLAEAAVQKAQAALIAAKEEQIRLLEKSVADAAGAVTSHAGKTAALNQQLGKAAEAARTLAERATQASFGSQMSALFRLCLSDVTVLLTCLGVFAAFMFIDMLPMIIKLSLRNGTYQKLSVAQDDQLVAQCVANLTATKLDLEQQSRLKQNQVDAIHLFCQQDAGALTAEKMLIDAQSKVDAAAVAASMDIFMHALNRLSDAIKRLREIDEMVASYPNLAPAYRSQLAILLADLQKRASQMAAEIRSPGVGGDNEMSAGTV